MTEATVSKAPVAASGAAAVALAAVSIGASIAIGWSWDAYVGSYTLTNTVIGLALTLSGVMIGWYRPSNRVGILFIVAGLGHLVSAAVAPVGVLGIQAGWPEVVTRALATLFVTAWTVGLPALFMLALLLFPDGELPSRRWRPVAWFIVAFAVYGVIASALSPVPIYDDDPASVPLTAVPDAPFVILDAVSIVASLPILIAVIASLVVRYVRGDERMRRQLLWLILAVFAMLALNAQRWITGDGPILLLLSTIFIPVAVAIAIVRYRLLDIRVVLSRTLLYGLLIAVVIALYAGLVAVLTLVVPPDADRVVAVAAAVAVALAFNPLRLLLQRAIGRAFYGTRSDPSATADRVTAGLDASAGIEGALAVVRDALRFPRLAVVNGAGIELAAAGDMDDQCLVDRVPLPMSGEAAVGELIVTLRAGERRLHDADRRSLALVTPLLGLILRERILVAELRRARTQTAEAREAERQLLHRDLHDGLGPGLTSAALRIDAARNVLERDPAAAQASLVHARADVGDALAEVRRVVYGLRPVPLDERGLVGALREYASRPAALEIVVTADDALPELSPAVELAAYRVALEGIANANRHSRGELVTVDVASARGMLAVRVEDDGMAPESFAVGVGIRSLTDRVEELGGSVFVGPGPSGWLVNACLPLRAPSQNAEA